jgi:hypothetical protein
MAFSGGNTDALTLLPPQYKWTTALKTDVFKAIFFEMDTKFKDNPLKIDYLCGSILNNEYFNYKT